MMRSATFLSLLLAGLLSVMVFTLKYRVQDLEEELNALNRAIAADRQAIHVLKAEWSHLNGTGRLKDLARRHLGLGPVTPEQIGYLDDLPMRPEPAAESEFAAVPTPDGPRNTVPENAGRPAIALANGENPR